MAEQMEYKVVSDGRRLDVLLSEETGLSRSRVASLMEEGRCVSAGKECRKAGTKLPEGQEIVLTVPAPREATPQAEDIPLEILYEDDDLAVVVKPRGMVVHPAAGHPDGTLVNALLARLDSLGGIGGELRPGIVHRLDKETSGLMLVAKNDSTQEALSRMLKDREIEKHYRALAEGKFKEPEGEIDAPIDRSKKDRKKMAVEENGRPAVTHYRVLERFGTYTYAEFSLTTGRTHQIRVHMAYLGHPMLGDEVYGSGRSPFKTEGQVLHARLLGFIHPSTGEYVEFSAPHPEDFERILRKLRTQKQ